VKLLEQTELAALRRYHNISQQKMADHLGINLRTYIYKENGQTEFKLSEMFYISQLLEKPIEEIFLSKNFMLHEVSE